MNDMETLDGGLDLENEGYEPTEVQPPPVIAEPAQAAEQPEYSDEELLAYAMAQAARNPELADRARQLLGVNPQAQGEPAPEEPDYESRWDGSATGIVELAREIAQAQTAPILKELEDLKWSLQQEQAAKQIAKNLGGEDFVPVVQKELQALGKDAVELYEGDPRFRSLFDDAMRFRTKGTVSQDVKPLPKSDGTVGAGQPAMTDEARQFDAYFGRLGIKFNDLS